MNNKKNLLLKAAKRSAEKALRRNANATTCTGFYQPKVPAELKQFKRSEK